MGGRARATRDIDAVSEITERLWAECAAFTSR
jgi:hypothetical protein